MFFWKISSPGEISWWTGLFKRRDCPIFRCHPEIWNSLKTVAWKNMPCLEIVPSLKLTYALKIDHWKRRFLLDTIIFRGELLVSGSVSGSGSCWVEWMIQWWYSACLKHHPLQLKQQNVWNTAEWRPFWQDSFSHSVKWNPQKILTPNLVSISSINGSSRAALTSARPKKNNSVLKKFP